MHSPVPRPWKAHLAWLLVTSSLLVPVLTTAYPRMVDLHAHVVRFALLQNLDGTTALDRYYEAGWALIPNLAADLVGTPVVALVGVHRAAAVMAGLCVVLWVAVPYLLHRLLHGRFALWPLFAALVVYNGSLTMGFVGYLLAAGVALLAFGAWVATAPRRAPWHHALLAAVALALYLGHLYAMALLGGLIALYEVEAAWPRLRSVLRTWGLLALDFALPTALFAVHLATHPVAHGTGTSFQNLYYTLLGWLSPTMAADPGVDLVFLGLVVALLGWGLASGRLEVQPGLRLPLGALAAAWVLVPSLAVGVAYSNYRLPFVCVALAVAATRWRLPAPALQALFGAAVVLMVGRVASITPRWWAFDREARELVETLEGLPEGAKLFSAAHRRNYDLQHWHSMSYVVVDRAVFLPSLFTGAHLVGATPEVSAIDHPAYTLAPFDDLPRPGVARGWPHGYLNSWWLDFDYVLYFGTDVPEALEGLARPWAEGSFFTVYEITASQGGP